MKRILSLILVLSSVFMLASCNGEKEEDKDLIFWAYEPQSMAHKNQYQALINVFEAENDIKVRVSWVVKDSYNQRLNNAILNNRQPDIAYLDQPIMASYVKHGHVLDITEKFNQSTIIQPSDFFAASLDTVTFDGKYYGMPLTIGTSVFLYNKTYITAPEDIKCWADVLAVANEKTSGDLAAFEGVGAGGYAGWYFGGFLKAAGSNLMNDDLTEVNFANEHAVEAMEYLRALYALSPDNIRNSQHPFGNGKALFKLGGGHDIDSLRTNFPNLKFGAMLMPPKEVGGTSYASVGGDNLIIFKKSKKADIAFKFMEFLNSESNALKIAEFTGNFPANDTAIKDHYQNDPERLVLREQLKTAVPRPKIEGWITVNDNNLGAAIEEILTTTVDIQTRLNRAKREAEAYLFKK